MSSTQPSKRGQKRNRGNRRGLQLGRKNGKIPTTGVNTIDVKKQDQQTKKQ